MPMWPVPMKVLDMGYDSSTRGTPFSSVTYRGRAGLILCPPLSPNFCFMSKPVFEMWSCAKVLDFPKIL